MARTHDDSWDITESVGTTALGVAMARAAESDCDCPLFIDPYAQLFVDAATQRGWDPSAMAARLPFIGRYTATRTKWLDEYFIAAGANGIDQNVILAAGLDSRAWRLPWVHDSAVYEIDQPQVLSFKADTLAARGARPATRYQAVPIDLRSDWPTALRDAGFDPSTPTAWSAEGLLLFLPTAAQDLLFERILTLSALGSRIAVDAPDRSFFEPDNLERRRQALPDASDLWFIEERADLAQWLADRGWAVNATEAVKLMERYDRPPEGELADLAPRSVFIEARLS
jgi:methyltransferase (TIGR00027 family)